MSNSRPAHPLRTMIVAAARLGVVGFAVVAAGCASGKSEPFPQSRVAAPVPPNVAAQWKVEIEEDGLPAQLAPRNPRPVPDDPREPWSPNYGSRQPVRPAEAAPPQGPARPAQVTALDEDAIIRRAIAEHEMRRQD